ncbi:MAG: GDP-mannose 4,6-dehydratase, partial [Flavobacteriales bacterium]|nr:GDP-mannose 4,6-dehydratase [Flavobacteriales bacterium]
VRDFVDLAFQEAGIHIEWEGKGENEKGKDKESGEILVEVDPRYFRPTEVDLLIGDASKAKKNLGWEHTYGFEKLVKEMVRADLELFERDKYLLKGGHKVMNYNE